MNNSRIRVIGALRCFCFLCHSGFIFVFLPPFSCYFSLVHGSMDRVLCLHVWQTAHMDIQYGSRSYLELEGLQQMMTQSSLPTN